MPTQQQQQPRGRHPWQLLALLAVWAVVYLAAVFSPPVLDDADATHAQAAQAMLRTGDWVTLHVDGIRYLEKPPLPYWITALSLRCFGTDSFAVHLPLALTVLALAFLARVWGRDLAVAGPGISPPGEVAERTGFYAALFTLTAAGVFLFTRVFIPDALLALLLASTLYASLRALGSAEGHWTWAAFTWLGLALAVLAKGLVALVFGVGVMALYLPLSGEWRAWRRLHPVFGVAILLAVAAPWHILAGLRNRGGEAGHGFFWFYFVNEHVLRFLGRRNPPDYNKLPTALYWSLHLVWLFPWSFFAPVLALSLWRGRSALRRGAGMDFAARSTLLLLLFSALVLGFFSLSTNQEYYTFPVYVPLLLLTAATLVRFETTEPDARLRRLLLLSQLVLAMVCMLAALALAAGLWSSRKLPAAADVGDLLAHRGVGNYTLSMSHFFDLTDAAFSGLRLPAAMACVALALGPLLSLLLRVRRRHQFATLVLALSSGTFLLAAHIAFVRFGPMLSSRNFAAAIERLEGTGAIPPQTPVLLFGDQALGSSIPFYLGRQVLLVDGRSTSMLFGSTFPDAPPIFISSRQLAATWGQGPRKLLFVPEEHRAEVEALLGRKLIPVYQQAGKALFTDRALAVDTRGQLSNNRKQ